MANSLKQLGYIGLAAGLVVSPAAGQHYYGPRAGIQCGCSLPAPMRPVQVYERAIVDEYAVQIQPSRPIEYAPPRAAAPRFSRQHYSPEEAEVLYHPVVVPLDEFLRPGRPVALTPEELARQRASAAARVTSPLPPQMAAPAAATPEADPFADDAAAETTAAPAATEGPTGPSDERTFAEEVMPAEPPASDEPEAPAESEPADAGEDPFDL